MPSLHSFSDVKQVLDSAITARGGSYKLASYGQAVAWRQRANKFRKQWWNERKTDQYEYLILRLDKGSSIVKIEFRQAEGEFIPTDTPAENVPVVEPEMDELDIAAAQIREKLGLE